ncbi:MAG: Fic family protein [Candidatus Omnitrophota bacterium]
MNLPINIDDLLTARTVEWERLEFKEGWNPEAVLHSLCAFANDFHNLGGGYIIIGIAERNGKAVLPAAGLKSNQIDKIQKEIVELGHKMQPYYHPIIVPGVYRRKHILVLWCVGGQTRPYKAPVSLSKTNERYAYYIRKASKTVIARAQDEKELFALAATVPFDDRMHHVATLKELDLGLIRAYLQQVKSDLFDAAVKMDFMQLCRNMNIVDGPDERVRPKNVGLMFFSAHPDMYFPQMQIDVVHFPQGPGADSFSEKIFKGPVHIMLEEALTYIKHQVITEKIVKRFDRPEADRFYNYPFIALKEALCNAVYHRSYEIREPIEVRILPDRLTIGSFPGPDRSISDKDMKAFSFISRRYRNRRVGEFLKELDMTEGRGTGIPKIIQEIEKNGSPLPLFHTDGERSYLTVEFPAHSLFVKEHAISSKDTGRVTTEVPTEVTTEVNKLLNIISGERSREALKYLLGLKNDEHFRKAYLIPAIKAGIVEMTIPDKPRSSKQKYRLTGKGMKYKKLLK